MIAFASELFYHEVVGKSQEKNLYPINKAHIDEEHRLLLRCDRVFVPIVLNEWTKSQCVVVRPNIQPLQGSCLALIAALYKISLIKVRWEFWGLLLFEGDSIEHQQVASRCETIQEDICDDPLEVEHLTLGLRRHTKPYHLNYSKQHRQNNYKSHLCSGKLPFSSMAVVLRNEKL